MATAYTFEHVNRLKATHVKADHRLVFRKRNLIVLFSIQAGKSCKENMVPWRMA